MHCRSRFFLFLVLALGLGELTSAQSPPPAGGVASAYRVLRSVSGTSGELRDGHYEVLDPRSEFQVPPDTQIVVFFEWLGAAGPHKLSGTWRGPSGTSTTTAFDYTAQDRQFGAYWLLTLPASIPLGDWQIDASIDGQPAGTHSFRIVAGGSGPVAPATAKKRLPLTRQELYERGLAAIVTIDALDASGAKLQSGMGVVTEDGNVLTSFSVANMAARLRVRTRGGATDDATSLRALSYRGGWAVIPFTAPAGVVPLHRAQEAIRVGAPSFSFDSPGEGTYVIAGGEVTGVNGKPGPEARISLSLSGLAAPGAPVLNEFGDLAALIPSNVEGRDTLRTALTVGAPADMGSAVPVSAIPDASVPPVPLERLAQANVFVPRVGASRQVLNGGFATGVEGRGPAATPVDQRTAFTVKDKAIVTFVTWMPKERFKGPSTARLYDMNNRLLGESKPLKANMRPNELLLSTWQFSLPPAGTYRVDVLLGDIVAWRGHFTVAE